MIFAITSMKLLRRVGNYCLVTHECTNYMTKNGAKKYHDHYDLFGFFFFFEKEIGSNIQLEALSFEDILFKSFMPYSVFNVSSLNASTSTEK